jgi:hypothetical protein
MRRIQIQLSEEQERAVRSRAARTGQSVAGIVRAAVDRFVASPAASSDKQRILDVLGKYRSDARDVSEKHDRYLAEAFKK